MAETRPVESPRQLAPVARRVMDRAAAASRAAFAGVLSPHDRLAQDLTLQTLPPAWHRRRRARLLLSAPTASGATSFRASSCATRPALLVAIVASAAACLFGTTLRRRRRLLRRLDRSRHLAPGRCLDGVPAGPAVDPAGRGHGAGPVVGDHRDRRDRLDAVLPGRARRGDGAAADGLCRQRARRPAMAACAS